MREGADGFVDDDAGPIQNFLKLGGRRVSLMGCEKSFASNVNRVQVCSQCIAAGNAEFVRRSDGENFHGFCGVAGDTESELSAKRRRIIEANDGVFGETFFQIVRQTFRTR